MAELHPQSDYRPRRSYLIVGIVSVVFFSVMAIGSAAAAYWNIDGSFRYPTPTAFVLGTSWSLWLLLGVWIVLAYFRERLILEEATITQHGIFTSKVIPIDGITQVDWRYRPANGSIVLRTDSTRIKIYLDNFTSVERRQLISWVRSKLPTDIQQGWSRFAEIGNEVESMRRPKRLTAAVCALLLFAFAVIFIFSWNTGLGVQWFAIGIACALAGLWYLWRIVTFRKQAPCEESGPLGETMKQPLVHYRDQTASLDCPFGHVQRIVTGGEGGVANVHVVKITQGTPHLHTGYDEVYYVLSGTGTITLDGQSHSLRPGSVAVIPANVLHSLEADPGEQLEFIIFGTPPLPMDDQRASPQKG